MEEQLMEYSTILGVCGQSQDVCFAFVQDLQKAYDTFDDSEAPAARLLHSMIMDTHQAATAHTDAMIAIFQWCYLAVPLLTMYIDQLRSEPSADAAAYLSLLEVGKDMLARATKKLKLSKDTLNKVTGAKITLLTRVRQDLKAARAKHDSNYITTVEVGAFESIWRGLVNIVVSGVADTKAKIETRRTRNNEELDAQIVAVTQQMAAAKVGVKCADVGGRKADIVYTRDVNEVSTVETQRKITAVFLGIPNVDRQIQVATQLVDMCNLFMARREQYLRD
ncbi:hypothetical protein SDRG_11377 [Saprolegnia diclina VS20]|uniref:Uncharacterized protein n=1 Tax=Saprolegnia diclina (strain VS20) TaxID=1156394 RepID=T0Q8F0_SAPDV|nr:hypothetical protein SDRG_11377 [Saprolegnia diclina VS20]EQC30896.1 hypothetical protein SDRG_11377 [Saprolegnia diclina VS20]|eukprot:XP_008615634.1 hypothetical protein SDRG_11377 [Saprolegnia diclina VS20]